MNGLEQPPLKNLINQLQLKKVSLIQQEPLALLQLESYFEELRQQCQATQQTVKRQFKNEILKYHERATELIQFLSSKTILEDCHQQELAEQFLSLNINDQPILPVNKLSKVIEQAFPLTISKKKAPTFKKMLERLLEQESISVPEQKDQSQKVIEKLQSERDYYQRRQMQLRSRLNDMQLSLKKKGVNIKQMSRSYLQDKCSKWALQRLTEEKKILVERIGEASQQILKLNSDIGELQHEIRKLNGVLSQYNGKSIVGTSTVKTCSMVLDDVRAQKILQSQERRSREEQLESRNQQLMIKLTQCMSQMQELRHFNKELQGKLEEEEQKTSELTNTVETLKQNSQYLNSDYQLSLKKKAVYEQENKELYKEIAKLREVINENQREYQQMVFELQTKQKDVIEKVKQLQQSKQAEIAKYEEKLNIINEEKQRYLQSIQQSTAKKGQQINYKALLNQEISRLHRQNATLCKQLELKEQKLFDGCAVIKQLESNIAMLQRKIDENKKQNYRLKKQNKELDKNIGELQRQLQSNSEIQGKIVQFEQNYCTLLSEFKRYKEDCDRKTGMYEKLVTQLRQKNQHNFTSQGQENKGKTKRSLEQTKSINEDNATLARKNAMIKQLKQEIKELKDKQPKSVSKRTYIGTTEDSASKLTEGVFRLGTSIMEERIQTLTTEKDIIQLSLKQLSEALWKEESLRKNIQADLDQQRIITSELKSKQKKEAINQTNTKTLKQKEQKIARLQNELKHVKSSIKKLDAQRQGHQAQIKSKRQLAASYKKESQKKEQIIRSVTAELALAQDELEKLKRQSRQISKKESLFKDIKQRKEQVNEQNASLKKTVEALEERIKLLNRQIAKKDQSLKERKNQEEKQIKIKEDQKLRETLEKVSSQKDEIRKLKADVSRKDQILKNFQNQKRELEQIVFNKEQQIEKVKREAQILRKKIEGSHQSNRKQQIRQQLLTKLIKKIFSICVGIRQPTSKVNRQSTHFYSASTISPRIKINQTPGHNPLKTQNFTQGLDILGLRPEDLDGLMGESTVQSRVMHSHHHSHHDNSWSMVSPIVCKNNTSQKQEELVSGLQKLQTLLHNKQLNSYEVERLFKGALGID